MVVIEVISPASEGVNASDKLVGYFRVPSSVAHYLIVHPLQQVVGRSPTAIVIGQH